MTQLHITRTRLPHRIQVPTPTQTYRAIRLQAQILSQYGTRVLHRGAILRQVNLLGKVCRTRQAIPLRLTMLPQRGTTLLHQVLQAIRQVTTCNTNILPQAILLHRTLPSRNTIHLIPMHPISLRRHRSSSQAIILRQATSMYHTIIRKLSHLVSPQNRGAIPHQAFLQPQDDCLSNKKLQDLPDRTPH
jgi:hypothetical protein